MDLKYQFRVTKYNPLNRDLNGSYLIDEWSSIEDIGKTYDDKVFLKSEYERMENHYINSILEFMRASNIKALKIVEVEGYIKGENIELDKIELNDFLSKSDIRVVARAILREEFWCKLEYKDSFFTHFGYDYIMYIGTSLNCEECMSKVKENDMFIESMMSPYYT